MMRRVRGRRRLLRHGRGGCERVGLDCSGMVYVVLALSIIYCVYCYGVRYSFHVCMEILNCRLSPR